MGKILIVDDNLDASEPLARLLGFHGHSAQCVGGGEAALALLNESVPDLLLLDVMMPGMDGIEVLRRVRAQQRLNALPVIMFSAVSDDAYRTHALSHGATEYWVKGAIDFSRIAASVAPYMHAHDSPPTTKPETNH